MEIFSFAINVGVLPVDFGSAMHGAGEFGIAQENVGTEFDIFSMNLGTNEPEPRPPR